MWRHYYTPGTTSTKQDDSQSASQAAAAAAGLGLKYKWDNIYIASTRGLLPIWPRPGYQSFAVINLLRYKPFKENVDKKSLPISIVLLTLIGRNLSADIYFIFSLRGHSKYPASQLEKIPADSFSPGWRREKVKVREERRGEVVPS